jgi:predicted aconitase with swiveling domain
MNTFKGRPIIAGDFIGEAVVTHNGLNILASFQKSALAKSKTLICSDQNSKELFGKNLTGKIICLPQTIGSTTGGMILQTVTKMGIGPAALLFADDIDSLAAAGVLLSEIWLNKKIITIDRLGEEFLNSVTDGAEITISADGTVTY